MLKTELRAGTLPAVILLLAFPAVAAMRVNVRGQIRARSLASVMAEERERISDIFASEPEEHVVLMGTSFPSLPTIRYAGSVRAAPPGRIDVIRRWVRGYGMDPGLVDDFRAEMLFEEDSLRLWLPVHGDLVEAIQAGTTDSLTLFLVWAGTSRDGDVLDWVFIVYGYRSAGSL